MKSSLSSLNVIASLSYLAVITGVVVGKQALAALCFVFAREPVGTQSTIMMMMKMMTTLMIIMRMVTMIMIIIVTKLNC